MLPPELLYLVCIHLEPRDILSLSAVNASTKAVLLPLRKLFLKIPYYSLRHSQWDTWQACVGDFEAEAPSGLFEHASIPSHSDEPLPADFQALEGNDGQKQQGWNYCDMGLFSKGDVLNLKSEPAPEGLDYSSTSSFRDEDEFLPDSMYLDGMQTETCSVKIVQVFRTDEIWLLIQYSDGTHQKHSLGFGDEDSFEEDNFDSDEDGFEYEDVSYEREDYDIAVADDTVILLKKKKEGDKLEKIFVPKGGEPVHVGDISTHTQAWGGLFIFNGRLFVTHCGKDQKLQVAPLQPEMDEMEPSRLTFNIVQDERYPRYGLAYTWDGLLMYVVDLQTRAVHYVVQEGRMTVVGISDGQLGMWTYSVRYMKEKRKDLAPSMRKLVKKLALTFQNNLRGNR
ncbi:hypothetical protein CJU89_1851 [Yarrowia sp. B02]|nr:hypothetical protein CJU89_1851 [Yarrowia sp. B02]